MLPTPLLVLLHIESQLELSPFNFSAVCIIQVGHLCCFDRVGNMLQKIIYMVKNVSQLGLFVVAPATIGNSAAYQALCDLNIRSDLPKC
jgi:hypothetical protein